MFRVELIRAFFRWRTWALAIVLGGIPIVLVISLVLSSQPTPSGDDAPPFYALILRSGFFAPLAALAVLQVFLLPLGASLLSADAVAGEASLGTLRYLLTRPVGRRRLLLSKYGAAVTLVTALVLWVTAVGLVAGGLVYGLGPLPTLSGATLSPTGALWRIVLAGLYVSSGMAGLAAIGIFVSTLTDSAPGATVVTIGVAIVSQIVDSLSALRVVHPYLLTHHWLAFVDLFRAPVSWSAMSDGLVLHLAYVAVFLIVGVIVFQRKDVLA